MRAFTLQNEAHALGEWSWRATGRVVGYLELRRLKLKCKWQLIPCLLHIVNGRLPTGSTYFNHDGGSYSGKGHV